MMRKKNLYMRMLHAQKRPHEALRRLFRRFALGMLGVDFSKQTEIQYVELGLYNSEVLAKLTVATADEIEFQSDRTVFAHNFNHKFMVSLSNVLVNTETNHVYVSEKSKNSYRLLKESSSWPTEQVLLNAEKPKYKSIKTIDSAALGLPNTGFYHWLSDDLPDFLMNHKELPVLHYKNSNVTNRNLMEIIKRNTIQCDRWVFVENLTFVTKGQDLGYLHPAGVQVLREFRSRIVENKESKYEKIYVSRSKSRRSIPSEDAIEAYLHDKGFSIVHAEDFSLLDQIEIFAKAKLVIGIHGAGLSHALWSEGCNLIELMPINRVNRCFEWQALICGGGYQLIYFDPNLSAEVNLIPQLELLNL
jgi:hypothetical protein